jgi:hypothetical protein
MHLEKRRRGEGAGRAQGDLSPVLADGEVAEATERRELRHQVAEHLHKLRRQLDLHFDHVFCVPHLDATPRRGQTVLGGAAVRRAGARGGAR